MKEKNTYKCDICDASFAHKPHLKGHIASAHEGKKLFKCDTCDAEFTAFQCNLCNARKEAVCNK